MNDVSALSIQKIRVNLTLMDMDDPRGDLVQVFQKALGADPSYLDIEVFQRSTMKIKSEYGSQQINKVGGQWTAEPPLSGDAQARIDRACEHILTELAQGDEESTVTRPYMGMLEGLRKKVEQLVRYCDVLKAKVADLEERNQELELGKLTLRREKSALRVAKESLEEQASHSPKSSDSDPSSPGQLELQALQKKILKLQGQLQGIREDHNQIFVDLSKKYESSLTLAAEDLRKDQQRLQSDQLKLIQETVDTSAKGRETTKIQALQELLSASRAQLKELEDTVEKLSEENARLEKVKKQKDKSDEKIKKLEEENAALTRSMEALEADNFEQRTMLANQGTAFEHQAVKIIEMFQPVIDAARESFPIKESQGDDSDTRAVLKLAVSVIQSHDPSAAKERAKMQAEIEDLKRQKAILLQMFGVNVYPASITTAALESMRAQAIASVVEINEPFSGRSSTAEAVPTTGNADFSSSGDDS